MSAPNQSPFLRTSWQFPYDNAQALAVQVDRAYIAIANSVNSRIVGSFPSNSSIASGETWFLGGLRYSGIRQIYPFTTTGNIPHGLNFSSIGQFTKPSGSFTDGTNWYGAIYGSNTAIAAQVSFYITPTNIVVLAGASAPTIVSGTIILEWVSQV